MFSIYKTDIGSFALSDALSDDRILELCREEGDSKGTVKFLVQHSSASMHVQQPLASRYVPTNHVPPVLPDQESFRSPSNKGGRSVRSNHDSKSSTSDHHGAEGLVPQYEESISEDDHFERDQRNTIRPPLQQPGQNPLLLNPSSPLDQRRMNGSNMRDQSPPKLSLSPARGKNAEAMSPISLGERSRLTSTPTKQQYSPSGRPYDEGSFAPPSSRRLHNHSASDAAAERERAFEQAEREKMPRKADRIREVQGRRRGFDGPMKRTDEPWVIVEKERGSGDSGRSTNLSRTGLHTPSNSHPGAHSSEMSGRLNYQSPYSASRANLPSVPPPPRNAPPPIPTSAGYSHRSGVQAVPPHWALKGILGGENQRLQSQSNKARLQAAKSMDNLRGLNSPVGSSRKQSQGTLSRPSVIGLRDVASSSGGSFMNMDMSPPSRREPSSSGIPRSVQERSMAFSPTSHYSRPFAMNASQSQSENISNGQSTYTSRPPPIQVQQSGSSATSASTYLNVSGNQGQRKSPDEPYPRPHSALDDIGASPVPSRHVRPLPATGSQSGSSSWIDVEGVLDGDETRSPRITSPHPYASQNIRPSTSGGTTTQANSAQNGRQGSFASSSSTITDSMASDVPSSMTDSTTVQPPRSLRVPQNPDSPRRTPLETRMDVRKDAGVSTSLDHPKSFVSMTQDSPLYEADVEGNSTLRPETHGYLANLIGNSSSEGTLKQGMSRVQHEKPMPVSNIPLPPPLAITESSQSSYSNATGTEGDEYDDEDFDDASSLWKVPSKPPAVAKPPTVEVPRRPNLVSTLR